jgi:DNA-binding CsgD family transcriptional regulator/PAS domain-containing protein
MQDYLALSTVIEDTYDAVLDSARWTGVLAKITDFVDGQAGGLLSKDSVSKSGNAYHHFGVDPHYLALYAETYWRFDPMGALPFWDVGQVASIPDLVPYDEFREGRFFREWVEPQGWIDAANTVLEKSVTSCAYLSIIRGKAHGMVDDEMRQRMALITPHVRRAVLIGRVIDLNQVQAASFADALDGINAGLFLVDANAHIIHANEAGHAILLMDDFLRMIDGRLVASDPEVDQALSESFSSARNGDGALGVKGIAVPLTDRDGKPYTAHVLTLTSGERRGAGRASTAVAALFVRKAALVIPSPPEVIAKSYRLTPTELRVLLSIVDVGGIPEVARALGISENTVRTHVDNLFEKTGATRQAELVKLVAGFSSPYTSNAS